MMIPEAVTDLFPATPSQGMNRSADQVRQTCRVYVDSGRVSEEGLESIIRLFNLGKAKGYSFDQTGALVDYSGATLSRLFAGKYEGRLIRSLSRLTLILSLSASAKGCALTVSSRTRFGRGLRISATSRSRETRLSVWLDRRRLERRTALRSICAARISRSATSAFRPRPL